MTILTKQEVMERYKLTTTMIRRHARDMGGRGKPLRFEQQNVEDFLRGYFQVKPGVRSINEEFNAIVRGISKTHPQGIEPMSGRGGRRSGSTA